MASPDGFSPVFVTGASGFVGACLVRRLLDAGHLVHLLLRKEARRWRLEDVMGHAELSIHEGDVADAGDVRAAIDRARPAVVVHLATEGAYEQQNDARRIFDTNVLGTLGVLEASRDAGVRLVVNAGSSSEYGFKSEPFRETDRIDPNSYYAVGKAAQTHLCSYFSRSEDLPLVTFRLFSVYGPWEEPTRLVPTLVRRARAGLDLDMVAPETARDFLYIDDVIDALTAFDRLTDMRGEVFNLGSGRQSSMRDVVEAVQKAVGNESRVNWNKYPARRWDTDCWVGDVSAARASLEWSVRYSLETGIGKLADWMGSVGDDYGPN